MTSKEEYIENLEWRLDFIKEEIVKLQQQIQGMFKEVEQKQEQAQHLMMLLKSEGVNLNNPELASLTNIAITDVAYDFLSSSGDKTAVHYKDLAKEIMAKGILITGKNPASNLLSHINRDERFVRTAPGTYGLKEWGLKAMPTRKRKSKKKN